MAPPRVERQLQMNDPAYQPRQSYDLKKEELDEIRKEKMYPFYDKDAERKNGDLVTEINDNSAQVQKQLNFLLPFFGFGFNYTWVGYSFIGSKLCRNSCGNQNVKLIMFCWSFSFPYTVSSVSATPWGRLRCHHCSSQFKLGQPITIRRLSVHFTAAAVLVE